MKIGKIIRRIRKAQGITQMGLSELTGYSQAYISGIEKGKKEPTITCLNNIAQAIRVPLEVLFFLSLDRESVKVEKRELFDLIFPAMKVTAEKFFMPENTES